jgi:hypothetical protein
MKSEIISTQESRVIDWSKVMLVKLVTTLDGEKIVLTSGQHQDNGDEFSGTVLVDTIHPDSTVGVYISTWLKNCFYPISGSLSILFTNE